jgi:hypothetical protein
MAKVPSLPLGRVFCEESARDLPGAARSFAVGRPHPVVPVRDGWREGPRRPVTAPERAADRPIFVVGVPRSGTTLLRYMLCSHPRIYIPPESNFIPRFFRRRPNEAMSRAETRRILERIAAYRPFWRDWQDEPLNPEAFLDAMPSLTPSALVAALYGRYAQQFGAVRWGDKSPMYVNYISLMIEMFPSAQIVHIVRDGRDVMASSLSTYRGPRFFYMDPYFAARRWRDGVRRAMAEGRSLGPEQYHQISYEALTAEPERRLRELCDFLREEFHPAMTAPQREARRHHHSAGIHKRVRAPINTSSSGRWRRDLSISDQRLMQRKAGDLLVTLGYELQDLGPPSVLERLRTAVLAAKYWMVAAGRTVLKTSGLFHPTMVLEAISRRRSHLARGQTKASGLSPLPSGGADPTVESRDGRTREPV